MKLLRKPSAPFAEKSRWVLLALLVPLLGFSVVHAVRYDDKHIIDLAVSPDGKQLYIFRGEWNLRTFPNEMIQQEVQVWDLQAHRLLATKQTQASPVHPSADDQYFFQLTKDGTLRILDAGTFRSRRQIKIPPIPGRVETVSGNERVVIVESVSADYSTRYLTIVDIGKTRPSKLLEEEGSVARMSADGRRLFIARQSKTAMNSWSTQPMVFDDGTLKESGPAFPGYPILVSGNLVLGGNGFSRFFYDLNKSKSTPWQTGVQISINLAEGGKYLYAFNPNGDLSIVETATGKTIGSTNLSDANAFGNTRWAFYRHAISPDGKYLFSIVDRNVWQWDFASGDFHAMYPDYRVVRRLLVGSYAIWCFAWIFFGACVRKARPLLDVLMIHAPLALIIVHAATRPVTAIHRGLIAISIGLLTSLLGMLIVWWVHGRIRWSLRLAGVLAGGAAVGGLLLAPGHGDDMGVWNVMLGSGSYVVVLAFLLNIPRWTGASIRRTPNLPESDGARWQMPLRDILLMTTAVALLLVMARFATPGSRPMKIIIYLCIHGTLLATLVFVCTVVAFVPKRLVLLLPLVPITAAIGGAVNPWVFPWIFGAASIDPLWWCETMYAAAAVAFLCSMLVFRVHGYRWKRIAG